MPTAAQQVDLDKVNIAIKDFLLLLKRYRRCGRARPGVLFAGLRTFDRRDDTLTLGRGNANLQISVAPFFARYGDEDRLRRSRGRDGDAPIPLGWRRLIAAENIHVRPDGSLDGIDPEALVDLGEVRLGQGSLQGLTQIRNETVVNSRKESRESSRNGSIPGNGAMRACASSTDQVGRLHVTAGRIVSSVREWGKVQSAP